MIGILSWIVTLSRGTISMIDIHTKYILAEPQLYLKFVWHSFLSHVVIIVVWTRLLEWSETIRAYVRIFRIYSNALLLANLKKKVLTVGELLAKKKKVSIKVLKRRTQYMAECSVQQFFFSFCGIEVLKNDHARGQHKWRKLKVFFYVYRILLWMKYMRAASMAYNRQQNCMWGSWAWWNFQNESYKFSSVDYKL